MVSKMRRRIPDDFLGPEPPPRVRRAAHLEMILREMEREIIMSYRRDLRIGLMRLYRALRRDIRMAIAEATGKKITVPEIKEEEEKEEKGFLENLFKFDFDVKDLIKMGGAALAGALAVLIITHWDDIYAFITQAKKEGKSEEEIKSGLQKFIEEALKK